MDTCGTHFPILAGCVTRTKGPVLELGCGDYSTPMLHYMCHERTLFSLETDPNWMARYADLANTWHRFELIKNWASAKVIDEMKWDVAFVDHAPAGQRVHEIRRLMDRTKWIVIHDTEDPGGAYNYASILPKFKYRYDFKRSGPWTSVVSMFEEFKP